MGCVSSSPSSPDSPHSDSPHAVGEEKGIVRKMTITLSANAASEDINISKIGSHYVIQGSKAVVDIHDCTIIGYLDDGNVFHNDESEYVKSICKKMDLLFTPK